ncbi:hypothetical protein WJX72_010256 [[Myrmecia] bisecta]|uniref:Tudor domain-containing protein n=1 Tax=[Myrmecia] bisecta TaxID=41462 RepID=A0AAW1QT50_9CHLO
MVRNAAANSTFRALLDEEAHSIASSSDAETDDMDMDVDVEAESDGYQARHQRGSSGLLGKRPKSGKSGLSLKHKSQRAADRDHRNRASKLRLGSARRKTGLGGVRRVRPDRVRGNDTVQVARAGQTAVGARVAIFWPADESYYKGELTAYDSYHKRCKIIYDDGEEEWLALQREAFKWLIPRDGFWHEGEIMAYDKATAKHHVLYADGEDEWIEAEEEDLRWMPLPDGVRPPAGVPHGEPAPEGRQAEGWRVGVYWKEDTIFYDGEIIGYDPSTGRHEILYDDGEAEYISLSVERVKWVLPPGVHASTDVSQDGEPRTRGRQRSGPKTHSRRLAREGSPGGEAMSPRHAHGPEGHRKLEDHRRGFGPALTLKPQPEPLFVREVGNYRPLGLRHGGGSIQRVRVFMSDAEEVPADYKEPRGCDAARELPVKDAGASLLKQSLLKRQEEADRMLWRVACAEGMEKGRPVVAPPQELVPPCKTPMGSPVLPSPLNVAAAAEAPTPTLADIASHPQQFTAAFTDAALLTSRPPPSDASTQTLEAKPAVPQASSGQEVHGEGNHLRPITSRPKSRPSQASVGLPHTPSLGSEDRGNKGFVNGSSDSSGLSGSVSHNSLPRRGSSGTLGSLLRQEASFLNKHKGSASGIDTPDLAMSVSGYPEAMPDLDALLQMDPVGDAKAGLGSRRASEHSLPVLERVKVAQ